MASVERERPRWSGPRLSRGPQVMVARGAGLGVAARGVGVRVACGRKRRDAMGAAEGEQGQSGGRTGMRFAADFYRWLGSRLIPLNPLMFPSYLYNLYEAQFFYQVIKNKLPTPHLIL